MLERIKKKRLVGFKEFVESLEISTRDKRSQIMMLGILEDPIFMGHVMKNIKTFDDVLKLPGSELETLLLSHDQMLSQFAKCFDPSNPDLIKSIKSELPRVGAKFEDELTYTKDISEQERGAAKYFLVKSVRKLQAQDSIIGFRWDLPANDIFFPKNYTDGYWMIEFDSKVLAAEGEIFKNKKIGPWKHYYDNGKLLGEGTYYDGFKVGSWNFYYANGALKSQGKYSMDSKVGIWKEYDRSGKITEVEYKDGAKVA